MKNNKGFTLVELIIVIAILAIIMLIAIPNFSGIQQRMQVRADRATAAQIGKAVRVWFTDCTTDKSLISDADGTATYDATNKKSGNFDPEDIPVKVDTATTPTRYENLVGIEGYISLGQEPSSLKGTGEADKGKAVPGQYYGVFLSANSTSSAAKIAVAILGTGYTTVTTSATDEPVADYNGEGAGIAYVEP